ncbi:Peptidoglycan/LPS O-acetylase OafA/YrhL, contains acyltransferase and SGNH-hydrolase domains [Arthrobacter sp. ov407]|uniref:acyltransferase family protein n=1 Tax=Arthrobacter sp. ov407 TaxID=1761748 RepID=UPI000886CEE9|nr:acyltransferase [Arthrobacter sp. ov407]SDL89985.1 Peptidoglycan/LPS O-acetylase OafA/YrhL, contains acyltransferase and SGNH-hydrolase domains [Arthrobacter sp. ov407]
MTDATPVVERTGALSAKPSGGPIIFFDVARGVSAQAVVLGHALNIFVPGIFMVPGQRVFYMQSFAVIIFFVLSGFLITSAVLKKKSQPGFTFGSYLIDRIARVIYPLIPALVLITVFDFLVIHGSTKLPFIRIDLSPQTIAGNFLLLFNHPFFQELAPRLHMPWMNVGPVGSGAPLWSVVAEWWIYVAFGLLAFVAIRRMKLGVGGVILLVFSIAVPVGYMVKGGYESLAWIIGMLYALSAAQMRKLPVALHGLIALLATAGFLASLYYGGQNLHAASSIGTASVAFCHLYFWLSGRKDGDGTASVPGGTVPRLATPWFNRFSVFLSSFSYSLYLIHFSVITYLWVYLHDQLSAWQLIPLALVVSNVLAYGYFLLVERHFHKVGKFLKARMLR